MQSFPAEISLQDFHCKISPAPAAIVLGFVAHNKIKAEKLAGYRKATTGLVLGTVVLMIVIVFMVIVAVFSLLMLFGQTL